MEETSLEPSGFLGQLTIQVALLDSFKAYEFLYSDKEDLAKYMSQVNHPNELGHELIANEIIRWFK